MKTEHDAKIESLTACYRARRDAGQNHDEAVDGMRDMSSEHNIDSATLAEAETLIEAKS